MNYLPPRQKEEFDIEMRGNLEGILFEKLPANSNLDYFGRSRFLFPPRHSR